MLIAATALAVSATPAAALDVKVVNESGKPADKVYLLLQNGSSTDGQLPANTSRKLSDITNQTFTIGALSAGRLYVSYDAPVTAAEPPHSQVRYDKIEFTNPGVANLTSVDFFGIPLDVDTLDSNGASLGNALTFRCHTSTILPKLLSIPGASGAEVKTAGGDFARINSPQITPQYYPDFDQYIQSMAGQTIAVNSAFYGSPYRTMSYTGTFQNDGSITLNGTITNPNTHTTVAGLPLHINGADMSSGIYTGAGAFTVNGAPANVGDNNEYSVIYRDVVAGFALGYWGGKYGNDSAAWNHQPAFAQAKSSPVAFNAWNQYASTITNYSDAYGFSFSDVGPTPVVTTLDNTVKTMKVTIDSDQGPNTPGCSDTGATPGSGDQPGSSPSNPDRKRVRVEILSRSVRVGRDGRAPIRLACHGDQCVGELRLTAGPKKRRVAVGAAPFTIGEGRRGTIAMKLTRSGRKLLRSHRGRVHVSAAVLVGPTDRPTLASSRRILLRR